MLKTELAKYPLEIEIVDALVVFMIYHGIETVAELASTNDETLKSMDGYEPYFLEAVHVIRGTQLN